MLYDLSRLYQSGFLARIEHHAEIGSTSDRALKLAAQDDLELPLLVLAERQTSGRGRGSNRWWAAQGALTCSLLLEPPAELPPARWPRLSLVAGLAVCEALEALYPRGLFQVKWPNDVFAEGKKISGILVESPAAAKNRLVIGIGVNVNNSLAAAPKEIGALATALCDLDGQEHDLTSVLAKILEALERAMSDCRRDLSALAERWNPRCFLTGKAVKAQSAGGVVMGRCLGIDAEGALILQSDTGRQALVSGTVVDWE
jgi:BirA family biotin operon repressor/biotin-[acetyl-CoA-carboxylase] ligase